MQIPIVVHQYAEESAALRRVHSQLVRAPHVKLQQLARLHERLRAHLDGLAVAGEYGWACCQAALESPGVGEVFVATVRALQRNSAPDLERLLALAQALPESRAGVSSAFGWVSAASLQGTARALLSAPEPFRRGIGIVACAMHRAQPGAALADAMHDADPPLRAAAFGVAGALGRVDLLPLCRDACTDDAAASRFAAAAAALLLGDRGVAPESLRAIVSAPGPWRVRAAGLLLRVLALPQAHGVLKALAQEAGLGRLVIQGVGAAGDPLYVPWLIQQMEDPSLARLAGESFSLITGLDLAHLDLERKPPENAEFGPNDDPNDDNVAMDEDDGLPWPDPEKIGAWWQANGHRFAAGTRYFMGEAPSPAHCLTVLKNGFQRQRMAAAAYLCLMKPGTPLFNTAAPAWRQQRWLDAMGA